MDALQADMMQAGFWLAVLQIIWINILLSGDNAVVIALACRQLPDRTRTWGIALGAAVAVILRILFTYIIATIMALPWLMFLGGLALFYIAIDLINSDDGDDEAKVHAHESLWRAVGTVAVADIVMSLDNVVAIAAVARNSLALLIIGLAVSIPLIIIGAALITALFVRYPLLVWAGAALLGWIAGGLLVTDPAVHERIGEGPVIMISMRVLNVASPTISNWTGEVAVSVYHLVASTIGAFFVVVIGYLRRHLHNRRLRAEQG
jgi:YjbE family integral membrane protein